MGERTECAPTRIEERPRPAGRDSALVDMAGRHVDIETAPPEFMEAGRRFIRRPSPAGAIIGIPGLSRLRR